mmetsp:Transcript_16279/g.24417  ORF Transcript_16279/g.24417 Transcript_16279/m.24417 type:complete len:249 (-) Transcript_16279:996-1742(-)
MLKSSVQARKRKHNSNGKKRKQHPNPPSAHGKKKKKNNSATKKTERFNIDKCVTTTHPQCDPSFFDGTIEVKVTGVDLCDDHTHGGSTVTIDNTSSNSNNGDNKGDSNKRIQSNNEDNDNNGDHVLMKEDQRKISTKEESSSPLVHDEKEGVEKNDLSDKDTKGNGNDDDTTNSANKDENTIAKAKNHVEEEKCEISSAKKELKNIFVRIIRDESGQLESSRGKKVSYLSLNAYNYFCLNNHDSLFCS